MIDTEATEGKTLPSFPDNDIEIDSENECDSNSDEQLNDEYSVREFG